MSGILARTTLRGALAQIRHVAAVPPRDASGLVTTVYHQVCRDFGMLAPPVILHAAAPRVLAAAWMMLRETLVATTVAPRAVKEAVACGVSQANACPYCVDVHTAALGGLVRPRAAAAVAGGAGGGVTDPALLAAADWARAGATAAGAPRHPVPPPAAELVGVAVTFHYLTRMVTIFLARSPVPPRVPRPARAVALRAMGALMAPHTRATIPPGASLDLLPAAPLPADLPWAVGHPTLAAAFGRATAAVAAAGARSTPVDVRDLVHERLSGWDGTPVGVSRAWVEDASAGLAPRHRAAGRLALLAALAPYQIGTSTIDEFRQRQPRDQTLVELASWASLAAAIRVGRWLHRPVL